MYAKLVLRNARRSIQDYLVYLLTMTICVTLFYSFLSISSSHYEPDIGTEYDFTMLSDGMKLAICAVTLILLFLIRFVNHYMLRRKQREFALQSVMGMEQRTIGRLFFAESFLMGLVSIAAGIFLGVFCSQFTTALLLTSYGKQYEITWTLFPDTVLLTAGFFILSFLVVGFSNTRAIRKMKIIDMLTADRENGPALRKSRWIWVLAIFFEVFSVWMCVTGVQKVLFYWDSRFALPVQLMFGGNILFPAMSLLWPVLWMLRRRKGGFPALLSGLLLCALLNTIAAASVPALNSRYLLALGGGGVNQYLLFVLVDLNLRSALSRQQLSRGVEGGGAGAPLQGRKPVLLWADHLQAEHHQQDDVADLCDPGIGHLSVHRRAGPGGVGLRIPGRALHVRCADLLPV